MSKRKKLKERFNSLPSDFTFDELRSLMNQLGFKLLNLGSTSGSRVGFIKDDVMIKMHKPHPGKIVGKKTLTDIHLLLKQKGLWED